jgi:hypothetical protein
MSTDNTISTTKMHYQKDTAFSTSSWSVAGQQQVDDFLKEFPNTHPEGNVGPTCRWVEYMA